MIMHRRDFINGIATAAGSSLLRPVSISAAEGAPETTSVTLAKTPALCTAPQFIAEELLRAEGFTEIRYVETIAPEIPSAVGAGKVDFSMAYASHRCCDRRRRAGDIAGRHHGRLFRIVWR